MRRAARALAAAFAVALPTAAPAMAQSPIAQSPIAQGQGLDVDGQDRARQDPPAAGGARPRRPAPPTRPADQGRWLEIEGFGHLGQWSLAATRSFDAILGTSSGTVVGGGGQVTLRRGLARNVFARVDLSRFRESGQRVFIFNGEIFELGIPTTITLTPIEVTGGYRFVFGRRAGPGQKPRPAFPIVPYAGLGVGSLRYEETSSFSDPADAVDSRFTSYHVLGGLDVRLWRWIGAGVEGLYRWVPDALGASGVSEAFNESNLDGATVRVRIRVAF